MDFTYRPSLSFSTKSLADNDSLLYRQDDRTVLRQRERKRETNRNAQRMKRERTKKRIEELETLVQELAILQQESQPTDSLSKQSQPHTIIGNSLSGLRTQFSLVQEETDRMAVALTNAEEAIGVTNTTSMSIQPSDSGGELLTAQLRTWEESTSSSSHVSLFNAEATPSLISIPDEVNGASVEMEAYGHFHPPFIQSPPQRQENHDLVAPMDHELVVISPAGTSASLIVPEPCNSCPCGDSEPTEEVNLWKLVNSVLAVPILISIKELASDISNSEDTAIRATVEGWDAVEAKGRLSPIWTIIRQLDVVLLSAFGQKERIAKLRFIHMQFTFKAAAAQMEQKVSVTPTGLPGWYQETMSQSLPHSYAIDFLCWSVT
jgi:hypothetical protein